MVEGGGGMVAFFTPYYHWQWTLGTRLGPAWPRNINLSSRPYAPLFLFILVPAPPLVLDCNFKNRDFLHNIKTVQVSALNVIFSKVVGIQ